MAITATDEQRVLDWVEKRLYIDGQWRNGGAGTLVVEDPATGSPLTEIADASAHDAQDALAAADAAFASWRYVAPRDRAEILRAAYELMMQNQADLALLMTLEMGKPLAEAAGEVAYAASFLRWNAEEAVRMNGRFTTMENGAGRLLTIAQPVGPCLFITPWNFPLAMGTRKVGPALAAGCTCVIKPAQQTPLSMLAMAQLMEQAGLPAGTLNILTASSSGSLMEPLIRDRRVRKLSFTGSTAVGRLLLEQAADKVLKTSMELGGNAPLIVCEDADLDKAVQGALLAKMRNGGEACTSANRLLVHRSVVEPFSERLAAAIGAMRVGRGTEDGVQVGPLIDAAQQNKVAELVTDAIGKGASAVVGGAKHDGAGYFYQPTVLTDVPASAELLHEEIFGPVAPIVPFADDDEAIAIANRTEYGLVSYLFTQDVDRGFRMIEALDSGMVGFNQGIVSNAGAPFGGYKQSGIGREGGPEGLQEFIDLKYVAMNVGNPATGL